MSEWVLAAGALLLAFANGANDNMKGVATLYGSGAVGYRGALALATVSTALGSLASAVFAAGLVRAFSAKGLVPDALLAPDYLAAVAVAAAATVLLATRLALPVSTTHALVGALAGAGAVVAGPRLDLAVLGGTFVTPLLAGPVLGFAVAVGLDRVGRTVAGRADLGGETCVCVEECAALPSATGAAALAAGSVALVVAPASECDASPARRLFGIELGRALDLAHAASACTVGFARGLNDTPKMLGLVVGAQLVSPAVGAGALALAMAAGGLVAARGVAETLATKLTTMAPAQGFAANAATSLLVAGASHLALPVSTTHVSAGGIFGIGASAGALRRRMAAEIVLAWVATLPLAAAIGFALMWAIR